MTIFGKGGSENVSRNHVGFGAEQVILVRDDCARNEISAYIGKQALVLTIVECKGLEFQDVLLYNFFGSSPLKSQWRVIYGYMEELDILDRNCKSFPRFSETKHNLLGSELKQLYVAITRTRQRLWICETNEELSKPMYDYWKKKSFVQVKKLDDSLAQAMQVASTPEEWKARGIKLFDEGNYEMATICFERAGNEVMLQKWSKAMCLEETAARIRGLNPERSSLILTQAAELFNSIGKVDAAANCYYEMGEYENAGKMYLRKCGETKLHEAGECFSLAGNYEVAAEVYAKGQYFSECLSVCSKGKLFETGMQYIRAWKQVDHFKELGIIKQSFLECCAHHYYDLKDNRSMMKFVKDFHTIDSIRYFLKKLNCLEELLLLEEELGNFVEASEIACIKGDFPLETELLEKGDHFKDASMLMLWYAFANSLWVFNSKGWPLKPFAEVDEILAKARSLAKKESDSFFAFVSIEVNLLRQEDCDLSQLICYLNASRVNESLRGEYLSVRKILDIHLQKRALKYEWENEFLKEDLGKQFEDKLSRDCVTVGTLSYVWNLLKNKFENIFKHLSSIETSDANDSNGYGEFCFNYFGMRKQVNEVNVIYLLTNSKAYWVRDIDDRFLRRNGNLVYINVQQFIFVVRNHFRAELLSVGLKLLDILEALHKLAIRNSMSDFCKSTPLIQIFEVTKYLLESKDLDVKFHDVKKLQKFLAITSVYFDYVFPLDWRKILDENMISLRRSDISRHLLEENCLVKVGLNGKPVYGKLGGVVMVWLGSGKPSKEFSEKILKIKENNLLTELFKEIAWKPDSEIPENPSVMASALHKLFKALQEAKAYNFESPNSFVYLLEHLLLWSSFTREFFFTTKSSLVEWIIGGDSYSNATFNCGDNAHILTKDISDYVAKLEKFIVCGRQIVSEWLRRSKLNFNHYYPLVLLRMIVTLCLVCANHSSYLHLLSRLLDKEDIASWLPRNFINVLRRKKGRHYLISNEDETASILAEALFNIGDPLVVASVSGNNSKFTCPRAVFVDMNADKESILKTLFPSIKSNIFQEQDVGVEAIKISNSDNDWQTSGASSSVFNFTPDECYGSIASSTNHKRFFTRKQVSNLKRIYQGFEALDQDLAQLLNAALDSRDVGRCSPIMYGLCLKQYALTGDALAKHMLDRREVCNEVCLCGGCNDDRPDFSGKGQRNKITSKKWDSANKGKGQGKSKKEKDDRNK